MIEIDIIILMDYSGCQIRLTKERYQHILEHPEMLDQLERIRETLLQPDLVVSTTADPPYTYIIGIMIRRLLHENFCWSS